MEEFVRTHMSQATVEDSVEPLECGLVELEPGLSPRPDVSLLKCWRYQYLKRMIDTLGALILILAFAVPGVLIVAAVVLSSPGPVFYREERIGRGGKPFRIWKFRSMYWNAPRLGRIKNRQTGGVVLEWRMRKKGRDPRITAVGRFLRRCSIDEIPQLLNVLRGEMSLIGPRPIVAAETHFYGKLFPYYLAATPGLSGAWQVSGRSEIGYEDRARLDALYVSSWSMRTDIGILLRTVPAVLGRIGAY